MGQLFEKIKTLVRNQRYVISEHAAERLEERRVLEWQVVHGVEEGKLLLERPRDTPHPSIESLQLLLDGTEVKAVWSHVQSIDVAKFGNRTLYR